MLVKCPKCMQLLEVTPGTTARCSACGYTAAVPGAGRAAAAVPPAISPPGPPPDGAHRVVHPPRAVTSSTVALGLFFNLLVPGTGTLYAGRPVEGWLQLALAVFGLLTVFFLIGLAFLAAAYVWAIAGSIMHLVDLRTGASHPS